MRHAAAVSTVRVDFAERARHDECERLRREIEQLREALTTRDTIGQAKGIIRVAFGCDDTTAFAALSAVSQNSNQKLRDVALLVIDSALNEKTLPREFARSMRRSMNRAARPDA